MIAGEATSAWAATAPDLLERILQQRRRRAHETIAIDADPTPLEQVLNTQSGPSSVALLDTALRTLALVAQPEDRELPALRGRGCPTAPSSSSWTSPPSLSPRSPPVPVPGGGCWTPRRSSWTPRPPPTFRTPLTRGW